jgi:hypothetical protein
MKPQTRISRYALLPFLLGGGDLTAAPKPDIPVEKDGLVSFEAEDFIKQTNQRKREWHIVREGAVPNIKPDPDPAHHEGASGGAYVEALPDTRVTHGDKLVKGENFHDAPGESPTLHYKVEFTTPGRYYVWLRTFSTGTEDNGAHVGINGKWPESGRRWQTTQKNRWAWDCRQRTDKVHSGVPMQLFLEIEKPGTHEILIGMREDGAEIDRITLARDPEYRPEPGAKGRRGNRPGNAPDQAAAPAGPALRQPRLPDGDGSVAITGELKQWHAVTLTLDGPFAHESDRDPNPFTDRSLWVTFAHESGAPVRTVPGYFAADGDAANTSAKSGTKWRARLSPDLPGTWTYTVSFRGGKHAAFEPAAGEALAPFHGKTGSFTVVAGDKSAPDLRARGRLAFVGKHHLQFQGDQSYFLKAGADAPETLLAFADFDDALALNPKKCPLKTWEPHVRDWKPGDPTWKNGKGKGLIGALNYLSGKGMNAFSFLPYNVDGDGNNVWPFTAPREKFHYDCSKLDQWDIVFSHAMARGLYLHFKMQETENDDHRAGPKRQTSKRGVPAALDGGALGPERKLYCRELAARFGHHLALNWNIGEETTQTIAEQLAMAGYIREVDAYDHHVVIHTYPQDQDKVYRPLLGKESFTGASLQNSNIRDCHHQVVKWNLLSAAAGRPWVVAFDEPGDAQYGMPPDPGWPGTPANHPGPDIHEVRKYALWGTIMAGGGGVEYYFGYKLPENDLNAQNWRSRDKSWDFARHALSFFRDNKIPFQEMRNRDEILGNPSHDNSKYCLAKDGETYLVYLPEGGSTPIDLSVGSYTIAWFNPRTGEQTQAADLAGKTVSAPGDGDWLAWIVRK